MSRINRMFADDNDDNDHMPSPPLSGHNPLIHRQFNDARQELDVLQGRFASPNHTIFRSCTMELMRMLDGLHHDYAIYELDQAKFELDQAKFEPRPDTFPAPDTRDHE